MEELGKRLGEILERCKRQLGGTLLCLVVYGSASRPEDYIAGLSDIDIVAICSSKPKVEERVKMFEGLATRVNALFLTPKEYRKLAKEGALIAHLMVKDSKVLYGHDFFEELIKEEPPRVTASTLDYLRRAALSALALGLEDYLTGRYGDLCLHLHKSFKHLVRGICLARRSFMPPSDREIKDAVKELGLGGELERLYPKIISLKPLPALPPSECRALMASSIEAFCIASGLRLPSLDKVERAVRGLPVLKVSASLKGDSVDFLITVLKDETGAVLVKRVGSGCDAKGSVG